jgi:hypothetical protein
MPMWDGRFNDGGTTADLPECVLFFAGTPEGLRMEVAKKESESRLLWFTLNLQRAFPLLGAFCRASPGAVVVRQS